MGGLDDRHHLARLGLEGSEAQDVIVGADQRLCGPACLGQRVRPEHHGHGNAGDAGGDALGLDLVLVHAHMGQLRVGEQAIGNEPAARGAAAPREVIPFVRWVSAALPPRCA